MAAESTLGSSYLLQLVGHYLCLKGQPGTELGREEVDAALALSRSDFETDVCRTTLNALSEVDVNFLVSMSEDQGSSRISDIGGNYQDVFVRYINMEKIVSSGIVYMKMNLNGSFPSPKALPTSITNRTIDSMSET